jgi:hypothetical protein
MLPTIAIAGTGLAMAYTYLKGPKNTVLMKGSDGKQYKIQNLPDKEEACERMCQIRTKLDKIIEHYKDNFKQDQPAQLLISRFNPNSLEENDLDADSTSYSENKGEKIVVCLRDKTKKPYPFVDENTVMFVLIHELAHLMTTSIGHTPEFWTNFRKMLHECISIGVYQPVNYTKNPVQYCGMTISDTPL